MLRSPPQPTWDLTIQNSNLFVLIIQSNNFWLSFKTTNHKRGEERTMITKPILKFLFISYITKLQCKRVYYLVFTRDITSNLALETLTNSVIKIPTTWINCYNRYGKTNSRSAAYGNDWHRHEISNSISKKGLSR